MDMKRDYYEDIQLLDNNVLRLWFVLLIASLIALPFLALSEEPEVQHFRTAYETRYGQEPGVFAAYGYDAYRMISAALREGYTTREALTDALMSGSSVRSVTSVGSLSPERGPSSPPRIYRVLDGGLEPVD